MPLPDIVLLTSSPAAARSLEREQQRLESGWNITELVAQQLMPLGHLYLPWCRIEIAHAHALHQIDIRKFLIDRTLWGSGIEDKLLQAIKDYARRGRWGLVAFTVLDGEKSFWHDHGFRPCAHTAFSDWSWTPEPHTVTVH